jgi:MFS family permease
VWIGQFVNIVGDAVFMVAVALYLLPREDAPAAIGLVLGASAIGGVVSLLVGGASADRYRRSRIIIASDLVRGCGLGLLLLLGRDAPLWALAAAAAVMGSSTGYYRPAYLSLLPTLVPVEILPDANAVRALTSRFAIIIGSALGGPSSWRSNRGSSSYSTW